MKRRNMAEQMFNDFVSTIRESQGDLEKTISSYTSSGSANPSVDVIEDDNNVTVKIDLPGVKKENAKVNISEDALELDALFNDEAPEDMSYITRERKQGAVRRIISLPAKINIEDAKAAFENGVLIVTLPKKEKKETHKVKVDLT